jgi:hypothetical protein
MPTACAKVWTALAQCLLFAKKIYHIIAKRAISGFVDFSPAQDKQFLAFSIRYVLIIVWAMKAAVAATIATLPEIGLG